MIQVFMFCLFVVGFQQAGAAYFQFVGKPKFALVLTLSRQALVLIPCLLILPRFFQLQGILVSGPIADTVSALVTGICIYLRSGPLTGSRRN
jgi:Na+-driven multidrug efflux pump